MSVEELHTSVIRCNGLQCDESYADVVPTHPVNLVSFAIRDGWTTTESGAMHFCPDCSHKRHARRIARNLQTQIVEALK